MVQSKRAEKPARKASVKSGTKAQSEIGALDDLIGQCWFFRTVTYHLVGRVKKRIGNFFYLEEASWVASSGRFMQAIMDGTLDEVEPVGDAIVNINAITDGFPWVHPLPKNQK